MTATVERANLRSRLEEDGSFMVALELETTRGLAMEEKARSASKMARDLAASGYVQAVFVTDNPGGNPHLRPETLGHELSGADLEVVINVSCKDYNRNGLESRLWALGSAGLNNVLALSGDYPVDGFEGSAAPVFDTDSVGLLEMIRQINAGLPAPRPRSKSGESSLLPTRFYPGAVVNPFKKLEGELMTQYFKLDVKMKAGARFAVTQIGFDSRKLDELRRYVGMSGSDLPMLGSIFVLSSPVASFFNRWGIPGVAVTDRLRDLAKRQAQSKDRGRAFFEELAAKQIAVLRGMGYRGAYVSGRPGAARIKRILDLERSFGKDDWKEFAAEICFPQPGEFYYFEQGDNKGLSSDLVNRKYLASRSRFAGVKGRVVKSPAYHAGRLLHAAAFERGSPGFKAGKALYSLIDKSAAASKLAHTLEQAAKMPLYGCRDCGDCSLPDIAYLCPESQCVKNQRNGPCGGTRAGKCEVLDKDCIWLRAYDRLKPLGEEADMLARPVIFRNSALRGSSAWANTFLGRDHHAGPSSQGGSQASG